jgi:Rap1a immunity proteins
MKPIILILITILTMVKIASANELTGQELLNYCQKDAIVKNNFANNKLPLPKDTLDAGYCYGYMRGLLDGVVYGSSVEAALRKDRKDFLINSMCWRKDVVDTQLYPMFILYLENHKEQLGTQAAILFISFMHCE